ncbi:Neuromedin-U receptor 2 [Anabarilius grahami]|uniref:Neuromedin-U receptor 2 n=1 Tax=Anabarilius grahami TaxID=495550 RepID=A0A3N0XQ31_ANAGA|nr:Neuromedin-U receptor 2 [Anabarilius grahami]
MIQFNCSSPDSLYAAVNASWCSTKEEECQNRTVNQSDLCLSRSAYLEKYLGPCRSPFFLPMCVTYLLIFIVGVLGNSLTCIVIARHRVMRTTTNYYLFSLAISDLLVLLLGLPLELYELWSNYPFLFGVAGCYFKTCLFEMVCFASVLNVTALSAERYRAVVHPLHAKHVATHDHAKRVILVLWAVSLLCALPNTSLHGVDTLKPLFGLTFPDSRTCALVHDRWIYNLLVQVTALLFFILPMLTISVLYVLIGLQLHRERECFDSRIGINQDGVNQRARHRQVTKMLCALVIVFGICWAPFHIDRVMWSYIDDWTEDSHYVFEYVHLLSGVFFYLSSVVNPILYNLMSSRFREMFREVVCQKDHRQLSISKVTLRSVVSASFSASNSVSFSVKFNPRGLPNAL